MSGQLDVDGGERVDPRVERAAKALAWRDARRMWGQSGLDVARENARQVWPRVRTYYLEAAEVALTAADG